MLIIPIQATENQTLTTNLNNQAVQIDLFTTNYGLFFNFWLANPSTPTVAGRPCYDRCLLVRDAYLGFSGDLSFVDQQGTSDPVWSGLGSRYLLYYFTPSDLAAL